MVLAESIAPAMRDLAVKAGATEIYNCALLSSLIGTCQGYHTSPKLQNPMSKELPMTKCSSLSAGCAAFGN